MKRLNKYYLYVNLLLINDSGEWLLKTRPSHMVCGCLLKIIPMQMTAYYYGQKFKPGSTLMCLSTTQTQPGFALIQSSNHGTGSLSMWVMPTSIMPLGGPHSPLRQILLPYFQPSFGLHQLNMQHLTLVNTHLVGTYQVGHPYFAVSYQTKILMSTQSFWLIHIDFFLVLCQG